MAEVSLRVRALPGEVDWEAWKAAGIASVQAGGGRDAGPIPVVPVVELTPPVAEERLAGVTWSDGVPPALVGAEGAGAAPASAAPTVVVRALSPDFALRHLLGTRVGNARVCGLDLLVATAPAAAAVAAHGGDPERAAANTRRYLAARESGYAPADLPGTGEAVGLLYGEDAGPLIAARADEVAARLTAFSGEARRRGAQRVIAEVDPLPADAEAQTRAVTGAADALLAPVPDELGALLRAALDARRAGVSGAVLAVPSDSIRDPERLADALDLLEGAGMEQVVLATNAAWLGLGAEVVRRAVNRLTGRPGSLEGERSRRTELIEA